MTAVAPQAGQAPSQYVGLRMTADQFLEITDDGYNYELVDGVVIVSPSPTPRHQSVTLEIAWQIKNYLELHPVGAAFVETDVHLAADERGDLVYRPEIVFVRQERLKDIGDKLEGPPDLVVEVVSRGSRRYDAETKKSDYEKFGVHEYWLIDPARDTLTIFRRDSGHFTELPLTRDRFESHAIPGFTLDIARIRRAFAGW